MSLLVEKTAGSKYAPDTLLNFQNSGSGWWIYYIFIFHRYSSFVNWELWWPNFPILVYFKETQTKPEGQIHFFPVIFVSNQKRKWNISHFL